MTVTEDTKREARHEREAWTPGPWECVPGNEHHGPYVTSQWGNDLCDCYTMSNPMAASIRNGGDSYPIWFCGEQASANAHLISAAPDLYEALKMEVERLHKGGISETDQTMRALAKARGET